MDTTPDPVPRPPGCPLQPFRAVPAPSLPPPPRSPRTRHPGAPLETAAIPPRRRKCVENAAAPCINSTRNYPPQVPMLEKFFELFQILGLEIVRRNFLNDFGHLTLLIDILQVWARRLPMSSSAQASRGEAVGEWVSLPLSLSILSNLYLSISSYRRSPRGRRPQTRLRAHAHQGTPPEYVKSPFPSRDGHLAPN